MSMPFVILFFFYKYFFQKRFIHKFAYYRNFISVEFVTGIFFDHNVYNAYVKNASISECNEIFHTLHIP